VHRQRRSQGKAVQQRRRLDLHRGAAGSGRGVHRRIPTEIEQLWSDAATAMPSTRCCGDTFFGFIPTSDGSCAAFVAVILRCAQ
jgi:hypothetical protein